jgi:hypothetical protein
MSEARDFLSKVVDARKRVIRMGRSYRPAKDLQVTIMWCEDLLNRYPSEATVRAFLAKHRDRIRLLIPARTATDKRYTQLEQFTQPIN